MMYLAYALMTLHMFVGIFLIGLILLQRGRGGGLAGAFGGMGGQSAFGTKAGDIFTRITIGVAIFWIVLACVCILVVNAAVKNTQNRKAFLKNESVISAPADSKSDTGDLKPDEALKGDGATEKKSDGLGAAKADSTTKSDGAVEVKPVSDGDAPSTPAKPDALEDKEAKPTVEAEKDKPASSTPPKSE